MGFWYLRLKRLILILHFKCSLLRFMWFFVFLLKAMIFGWLIIFLNSTKKIMELGNIILILFHVLNCLYCYYCEKVILLLKFETWCAFLISWSLFIYLQFILVMSVCVCNYWEFCFINLRIVNYFVGFGNYALATQ